jgi:hypothetical protein
MGGLWCALQRWGAIGRRLLVSRMEQSQSGANERRAVGDLCDVDPWAKPGFP